MLNEWIVWYVNHVQVKIEKTEYARSVCYKAKFP